MSQADRHARQQEQLAQQAAAMLRQRQALAPKPLAVYVAMALATLDGGVAWRECSHSTIALDGAARARAGVFDWGHAKVRLK